MTREEAIGSDPIERRPIEDRAAALASRARLHATSGQAPEPALVDSRMLDSTGRERRYRAARRTLIDESGGYLYLAVLQDTTGEHLARERADRSLRELDDWFDLSPVGMVLSDERGLLVRTNPAFDALAGALPASLADAPAGLRELLGWRDDGSAPIAPELGAPLVQRQGWVTPPGQGARLLRASVRSYQTVGGQRRTMAMIEDRSVEEERDLAQVQRGALMDTAGVGLATFQESSGWVRQHHVAALPADGSAASPSAALHAISREIVAAASLPEFERLQAALRRAERAEVRYAIVHPELGERWQLTRVEPATLALGKRTTSVVTIDITEHHLALLRTEQLLHELTTILESTSAGIAYLRDGVVARCNRRFEAMLNLEAGALQGRPIEQLLGRHESTARIALDARQAVAEGSYYETEFDLQTVGGGRSSWYSLSVRPAGSPSDAVEAIAVLSDVTRLKARQQEFQTLARESELMFSLSGVGIAFLRDDGIQRANQAFMQLIGCSAAELTRLRVADLSADRDEFERRWPQVQASLRAHGRWTGEHQMRTRDGRALWVQVSKRLVTEGDPSGGIIASYVNVDARYRAERAVAMQADRTRSILDSVLVGIVSVGPQGIEWMNRSARRMFGGDLADFINLPIATVATPEADHPFRRTEYLTDLVEGQAETFECRLKARDGRQFWVVGNVVSTGRESTGRQLTYALLDIERRREAEARMSQAQAQLQRIIEAAPLAITLRDAQTLKVLQVNGVAAAINSTTPEALIGRTPEQIFDPQTAAERRRDMQQALTTSEVTKREYHTEQGGEPRIWDARYLPLASGPGQPDQLLLVATDVTEQRAAQEARLEAAIAQREMLVKEVHHRIKNNLQGVAGLLQQIAQRKPEVAGPISEVVGQVQAIAQVYGLQVGESGPLELVGVVRAITGSVQRTFGHAIRFEVGGDEPSRWQLPEAESIPIALTLNELLTNAVKHSVGLPDATVVCTLACSDTEVQVLIANRGSLPNGFNIAGIPGGASGLGLVRALLPRRSARLTLTQQGDQVLATVLLWPPGVVRAVGQNGPT